MSFGKPGSEHGLWPWVRDFEDAKPIFKKAIELGINYFDTANVYQLGTSEEVTGSRPQDHSASVCNGVKQCVTPRDSAATIRTTMLNRDVLNGSRAEEDGQQHRAGDAAAGPEGSRHRCRSTPDAGHHEGRQDRAHAEAEVRPGRHDCQVRLEGPTAG
ncbi:MAG: aldo/keto reductase [Rhodocyclaceae bacterium]|nr:aldo/keto reductase [Rhodocyclaceae bacterium]